MNFLSHYYFDEETNNAYFNFGLLLPDLVRNFTPSARLKITEALAIGKAENQLLDGCRQHVASDKVFHSWTGFIEMMDVVTAEFRNTDTALRKDWFVAHIGVELIMDHYLLIQHSGLAKRLYTDFEQLDMLLVKSFLSRNHLFNFESFQKGFDRFMEVRYLEKYHESASIVYALGRICNKVNLPPFTDGQKKILLVVMDKLMVQMPSRLCELREKLK